MKKTKQAKILAHLESGKTLTAAIIRKKFKLKNPYDAIYKLRHQGVCVLGKPTTRTEGLNRYKIGTPNEHMIAVSHEIYGAAVFGG